MAETQAIEIYQSPDGQAQVTVRFDEGSVWLSQAEMVQLFDKNKRTISEHIRNVFREGELEEAAVVRKSRTTAADGKRYSVQHYNLDVIISVGYRVKSQRGTQFRIWATRRLREYLVKGYSINEQRFQRNAAELQQALAMIEQAAGSSALDTDGGRGLVEIVSRYTRTFLWLQRYDEGLLEEPSGQPGGVLPSILGNLEQSVFGEPAYPTVESKASHLLYFVVKNHPFSDGNKRSGAFLFVGFLHRNGRLMNPNGEPVINDTGLAALTLLVAASDPKQKETLIRLIMHMLGGKAG